jgi:pyruvate kinase
VSKYRPRQIIIAATTRDDTARRLLLYSGIVPVRTELAADSDAMIHNAIRVALESGTISPLDKLVSVAGIPVNSGVMTNTIRFHVLGTVLARGSWGRGESQTGRVVRVVPAEYIPRITPSDIVVVPMLGLEIAGALEGAGGIIVEEPTIEETGDEILSGVPIVAGVHNALESLEDGLTVTIDGAQMIVYEGVMMSHTDSGEERLDR